MTAESAAGPAPGQLAPLVVVGPTASGKSTLAIELAERVSARGRAVEIISADAMAVYAGMDIGTAAPSVSERKGVPHHLIDVVAPGDEFTLSSFVELARAALEDIEAREAVPIIVGGTGLYVRALVDGFTIPGRYPEVRASLEAELSGGLATEDLHRRLVALDPVAAGRMEPTNDRRIVRALEVTIGSGQPFSSFGPGVDRYPNTRFAQVGLDIDRTVLDERIATRYRQQLESGFLAEAENLSRARISSTARQALGYRELWAHLDGECSLEEALELAIKRTRRFARRQQRWFRRDPRIQWFPALSATLVGDVHDWWCTEGEFGGAEALV